MYSSFSNNTAGARREILHNIDPLTPLLGQRLYNDTFDTRMRAAMTYGQWKILTGDPRPAKGGYDEKFLFRS